MVYSIPFKQQRIKNLYTRTVDHLDRVNQHPLGIADQSNILSTASRIKKRQYLPAAAGLMGGTPAAVATESLQRGLKTSFKTKGSLKKKLFGFTRGMKTGVVKNRRNLLYTAVPGSAIAPHVNSMVAKSKFGQTKVGQALTKDLISPTMRNTFRSGLRKISGGLFYFMGDLAEF